MWAQQIKQFEAILEQWQMLQNKQEKYKNQLIKYQETAKQQQNLYQQAQTKHSSLKDELYHLQQQREQQPETDKLFKQQIDLTKSYRTESVSRYRGRRTALYRNSTSAAT